MECRECGFHMWSDEAKSLGYHPECVEDEPETLDLEDRLDRALEA